MQATEVLSCLPDKPFPMNHVNVAGGPRSSAGTGGQFDLRPGMGFPLVASRRAASCSIRSNNCCTSPITKAKAWMRYVIFGMAGPRGPRLSAL
jgi:hypothetical protein